MFGLLATWNGIAEVEGAGALPIIFMTEAIPKIGGVVAICVGGFFAFLIVKVALKWARSALKG